MKVIGIVAALNLAIVTSAYGQACWGNPAVNGQFGIGGSISVTGDVTGYSGSVGSNLEGPLSVMGTLGIVEVEGIEENATSFGGQIGYEVPTTSNLSVCPTIGVTYSMWDEEVVGAEASIRQLSVPVALAVGTKVPLDESMALIPSASAGLVHLRQSFEASGGGEVLEADDSTNEFIGSLGLALSISQLWFGGIVSFDTVEESDPTFSLGVGFVFP